MRVALDVTATITGSTGVARYARQLTRALADQGVEPVPYAIGRASAPVATGVRHLRVPLRVVHAAWKFTGQPSAERLTPDVDLVHAADLLPPPTRLPTVVTMHDLTAIEHPEFHPPRRRATQTAQLNAARRASAVICVSHATARRVIGHGVDAEKVVVTPLGVTPAVDGSAPSMPIPPKPYVLAVGERNRRKGHDVLLEALARADVDGLRLVLAGPPGFESATYDRLVQSLGLEARTTTLGAVDDATLAALYRAATALCFPSRAEGFGLPVLEAMAAGTPVVASDIEAVREVAGDAVLYVPAGDPAALGEALRTIVSDDELRARLAAEGRARAAAFTWQKTAQLTVDAYRLALA